MSKRELRRVEVLARVKSQELKLTDAASLLGLRYRQGKRLWRRYRQEGAAGLQHRSAGRTSPRAKPAGFCRRVLQLVREKYGGGVGERFGPTLAAEHLASEDQMRIDAETLRRWMLEKGLWNRERKRKAHRQRRERRRHFGELVQMDGSFHDWLEQRGPDGCMMNMTDDATSRAELRLGDEETIWAAANTLRAWIEKYGVPQALYVDWKNLYKRAATAREQLRGEEPVTQFGRMCEKLGIRMIAAGSPQAKGRVERNHGTHQDRLIKKMRRKKTRTQQDNLYLQQQYLPEHNQRQGGGLPLAGWKDRDRISGKGSWLGGRSPERRYVRWLRLRCVAVRAQPRGPVCGRHLGPSADRNSKQEQSNTKEKHHGKETFQTK
jgi:hypothetical protein